MKSHEPSIIGCKLLRADYSSVNGDYGRRVIYAGKGWQKIPGNGAYLCVTGGLQSGGKGPILAWFRGRHPTGAGAPDGVQCFAEVKRISVPKMFGGNLDLRGCTNLAGVTLPQTIGGNLYLG
jgi:hypothetical protein